jgi:hypothetical protein
MRRRIITQRSTFLVQRPARLLATAFGVGSDDWLEGGCIEDALSYIKKWWEPQRDTDNESRNNRQPGVANGNCFALRTNKHKECDGRDDNIEAEEGSNSRSEQLAHK